MTVWQLLSWEKLAQISPDISGSIIMWPCVFLLRFEILTDKSTLLLNQDMAAIITSRHSERNLLYLFLSRPNHVSFYFPFVKFQGNWGWQVAFCQPLTILSCMDRSSYLPVIKGNFFLGVSSCRSGVTRRHEVNERSWRRLPFFMGKFTWVWSK